MKKIIPAPGIEPQTLGLPARRTNHSTTDVIYVAKNLIIYISLFCMEILLLPSADDDDGPLLFIDKNMNVSKPSFLYRRRRTPRRAASDVVACRVQMIADHFSVSSPPSPSASFHFPATCSLFSFENIRS